jgi:hypothetical protein
MFSVPNALPTQVLAAAVASEARELYARRVERKLVLTPPQAKALRAVVDAHMAVEHFVAGRDRTRIHSTYLDTADFALYHQSLVGGDATGLKLRIRSYSDAATASADSGAFLEAKLAVSTDGTREKNKARLNLTDDALAALMAGEALALPRSRKRFWRPLLGFMAGSRVAPRLAVSYSREAFVDETGALRVTFDEHFQASAIAADGSSPLTAPRSLDDVVILEIKFVGEVPEWLNEAIAALDLPVGGQSFSKYKTAVGLLFPEARPVVAA